MQQKGAARHHLEHPVSSLAVFANCHCSYYLDRARAYAVNWLDRQRDPHAAAFYSALLAKGCDPKAHIDLIPSHRLLYLCVPKCASTTIKMELSALGGRTPASFEQIHKRRYSGLKSPFEVGLAAFRRLALDPQTLRFSFVRNPYDRLVSAWADKYQNRPLTPGNSFIDKYLRFRSTTHCSPVRAGETLSFAGFVHFATTTAADRLDPHWQLQDDILDMPGIALDFVGKVESFEADFARVLEHVGADRETRASVQTRLNQSRHQSWQDYYTPVLADQVYRTYERDFDRLRYPRAF
jgi:hypothetical protein